MPAQMYVIAVIGTIAAAICFKEFVYEPHIAPNVERWAEQFIAHRQARRRQREVSLATPAGSPENVQSRSRQSVGADSDPSRSEIELESLVAREVDEWRSKVNQSRTTLRHRKHVQAGALHTSNVSIPYVPISPTHVIFDTSLPTTPTSEGGTASHGSPAQMNARKLDHSSSATLRSPAPPPIRLPTPDPSLRPLSPGVLNDASIIASYEVANGSDSSRSNVDLESVSGTPFSSRPQSPLSVFSAVGAPVHQMTIFEAPVSDGDFLSDSDSSSFAHSTSNVSAGGSVNGDDFDVQSSRWDGMSASSWVSAVSQSA